MFFSNIDNSFKILSVVELSWSTFNSHIPPKPWHAFSMRLRGNARFINTEMDMTLNTNDLVYIPAGYPYEIQAKTESLIVIHFEMSDQGFYPPESFTPRNAAVFEDAFRSINNIWNNKKPGYYHRALSVLYKIFAEISKQLDPIYTSASYYKIKESINYLHQHYTDQSLTVDSLCKISNLSATQFRKSFYEIYGTTPLKYLNTLRIDYAVVLLDASHFSIEEISEMSGFSNSKYFSTIFKKYKALAPSSYRKVT